MNELWHGTGLLFYVFRHALLSGEGVPSPVTGPVTGDVLGERAVVDVAGVQPRQVPGQPLLKLREFTARR